MKLPFNIVTLWNVLKIDAPNVLNTFSYLGSSIKHLEMGREEMIATGGGKVCHISANQLGDLMRCGSVIGTSAESLGMVAAEAAAGRFGEWLETVAKQTGRLSSHDMGQITALGSQMLAAFGDEMAARLMFVMSSKHAGFYGDGQHFGAAVDDSFPSASQEITDAAKCRALGQWTACVLHLMRALEPALNALTQHVGVEPEQNWNNALNQIDAKLRGISKAKDGLEAEQWAAEASAHFRSIKNAWRNHAAHGRARYNEDEAVAIFDNVRVLMQTLAARLIE